MFFRKYAARLAGRIPLLRTVPPKTRRAMLLCATASVVLAASLWIAETVRDPLRDGVLIRDGYDGVSYDARLTAEISGTKREVTVHVDPLRYSASETEAFLRDAEERLPDAVFPGGDTTCVSAPLSFPASLPGNPVRLSYMPEDTALLHADGTPGEGLPGEGADTSLYVTLSLQDVSRILVYRIRLVPGDLSEEARFASAVRGAAAGADPAARRIPLPSHFDGEEVRWKSSPSGTPLLVLLSGLLASCLLPLLEKEKKRSAEAANRGRANADYPVLTDKIALYLRAGISLRNAVTMIADDYTQDLKRGCAPRPGYEAVLAVSRALALGVTEEAALQLAGESLGSRYRTLSSLLVTHLTCGGEEALLLLEKEARDAFEAERLRAKVRGEEATTKLLFPMLLMLGVILAVLIIPAFCALGI